MNNHYHLLVTTPEANLDKFMELFNRRLSQQIKRESGAENHKFANRYKWTIVNSRSYLFNIYRYIYQNPIRANLCRLCIDYPYSSLKFSVSQVRKLGLTVHIDYFKYPSWMEQRNGDEVEKAISMGLAKQIFKISNQTRVYVKESLEKKPV